MGLPRGRGLQGSLGAGTLFPAAFEGLTQKGQSQQFGHCIHFQSEAYKYYYQIIFPLRHISL